MYLQFYESTTLEINNFTRVSLISQFSLLLYYLYYLFIYVISVQIFFYLTLQQ